MSIAERYPAVVVGGGPAGLATSAELRRRNIGHVVLERGAAAGHSWMHFYDSLTLHTGKHLSTLPGLSFGRRVPMFPTRRDFVAYLHRYVEVLELPIETNSAVTALDRHGDAWMVRTAKGDVTARDVVVATGIASRPARRALPGVSNTAVVSCTAFDYRRPDGFAGRRVLVVGVGNSGGEIASELAHAGANVTVAVRSGANVVPLQLAGVSDPVSVFAMRNLPSARVAGSRPPWANSPNCGVESQCCRSRLTGCSTRSRSSAFTSSTPFGREWCRYGPASQSSRDGCPVH